MTNYVFYSTGTGAITQTMTTDTETFAAQQSDPWITVQDMPDDPTAWQVQNGALVALVAVDAALIARAVREVNDLIGQARSLFITIGPGQEMTYLYKKQEAQLFLSVAPEPTDLAPYPFVAGEIGVTGETAYQVAQVITNLAAQWTVIGSAFESLRITTNSQIAAAATRAELATTIATFETTLNYILAQAGAAL